MTLGGIALGVSSTVTAEELGKSPKERQITVFEASGAGAILGLLSIGSSYIHGRKDILDEADRLERSAREDEKKTSR